MSIVDLPEPVSPHTATIDPAGDLEVEVAQHGRAACVGEADVLEAHVEPALGQLRRVLGSGSGCTASSQAKARLADAIARWARLRIQPSASSGHTSCSSRLLKSTNCPIVRFPSMTSRPPKKSTLAIAMEGRNVRPGR